MLALKLLTPEQWASVEHHFADLIKFAREEQAQRTELISDPEVRAEVRSLLENAGEGPTVAQVILQSMASADEVAGRRIGHYRLLRRLGQGGQGTVFEGVRDDGTFHRRVAIKLIKWDIDSAAARERFRQERQILAAIEHPYVARLLDGGETEAGAPYLVMEFVQGQPLIKATADWSRRRKLELFLKICEAVEHAHRNLVVHRDLKPANIMVTESGDPKLLDFGIAKLLNPGANLTQTGLAALTPDYASPEQVRGEPITTASDVYSLGVILYQLLSGRKPYSLETATLLDMERVICQQPPASPGLGDELDQIVLMALRKEPQRRYPGASRFAEDIVRYLEYRPVLAQPDSMGYRTAKFLRRNWLSVGGSAAILATLAAGLAVNAVEQRRTARRFNEVRQLANTFLFDFHDEIARVPGTIKAREMIVTTALKYLSSLEADAGADSDLQWEIAQAYAKVAKVQGSTTSPSLRKPAEGMKSFDRALAIGRPLFEQHLLNADQSNRFVNLLLDAVVAARAFKRHDAVDLAREAVAKSAAADRPNRSRALGELAISLGERGDLKGAEASLQEVLRVSRENLALDPSLPTRRRLGVSLVNLAASQARLSEFAAARQSALEGVTILRRLASESPADPALRRWAFLALTQLGDVVGAGDAPSIGQYEEAADYYEQGIALLDPLIAADPKDLASRNDTGLDHVRTAYALADTNPRRALGHAEAAAKLLAVASPQNTDTRAQPHIAAGNAYRAWRQFPAAEGELRKAESILISSDNDTRADLELAWARLNVARSPGQRDAASAAHFERRNLRPSMPGCLPEPWSLRERGADGLVLFGKTRTADSPGTPILSKK